LEETEIQEPTISTELSDENEKAPVAPRRRTRTPKPAPLPEDTVDVAAEVASREMPSADTTEISEAPAEERPRRERAFKREPREPKPIEENVNGDGPATSAEAPQERTFRRQQSADATSSDGNENRENREERQGAQAGNENRGEQRQGGNENRGGDRQAHQQQREGRNERRWGRDRENRGDRGGQPQGGNERVWPPRNGTFDGDRDRDERPEREPREPRSDRPQMAPLNIAELEQKTREQLAEIAIGMGLEEASVLRKTDLIFRLLQHQAEARGNVFSGGFLEVSDDGNYGFLRGESMLPGPHDIYVSQSHLRRLALRPGDYVTCQVRHPKDNEKYYGLLKVEAVNGIDPEVAKKRPFFENLTAIFPKEQLKLETTPDNLTHRLIDLIAPIGRGQRGLIVSPPKAGKTMLLKNIANGIATNYPDVHLIVLLIGERPEEVTDMQRSVRGEVVASTFDEPVEDHTRVAEMALERAKRLVEGGKDVVILMDSITRLTRAYNLALPPSGRTLSGGVDPVALYPPKRLFGAARKCEEAGSLTVLATCLVDTGSRMDEVVFEEFKGTGNLELRLDRKLAERRFYPAIDVQGSGTRREELLLDERTLKGVWLVRRMTAMISQSSPNQLEATERLLERIARTSTNDEFLSTLKTEL
jgi:transcription termination factor Rho